MASQYKLDTVGKTRQNKGVIIYLQINVFRFFYMGLCFLPSFMNIRQNQNMMPADVEWAYL